MHTLPIDTSTPMPAVLGEPRFRYPFSGMLIGHSLYFNDEQKKESARVSARQFVRTHQPDWEFKMVRDGEGWRLWRIR